MTRTSLIQSEHTPFHENIFNERKHIYNIFNGRENIYDSPFTGNNTFGTHYSMKRNTLRERI